MRPCPRLAPLGVLRAARACQIAFPRRTPAGRSLEERAALLHIVIVGGGPTGVEVAGELVDFVDTDIKRLYPDLARDMRVTLIEGRDILGSFDVTLREYAARHLTRQGVKLVKARRRAADAPRAWAAMIRAPAVFGVLDQAWWEKAVSRCR